MKASPISLPFVQETPATLRGDPGLLQRGEGGLRAPGHPGRGRAEPQRQLSGGTRGARSAGGGGGFERVLPQGGLRPSPLPSPLSAETLTTLIAARPSSAVGPGLSRGECPGPLCMPRAQLAPRGVLVRAVCTPWARDCGAARWVNSPAGQPLHSAGRVPIC